MDRVALDRVDGAGSDREGSGVDRADDVDPGRVDRVALDRVDGAGSDREGSGVDRADDVDP
ncbi:hypothetical protein AB0F91_05720, partial [Amycolatopsis sp. NPDC023774]|uniref:hypothetical protein n=1 Tax=Amycolatopsis sp. NPDC023774 TaxID=3155015 RepID=UPI00340D0C9A